MALNIKLFACTGSVEEHPTVMLTVPAEYKILGGGAVDNWSGAGNLLTASYPMGLQTWFAAGKDHQVVSPASITAYALALHDPDDEWDVTIAQSTSDPTEEFPQALTVIPTDCILTGGGAFVDYGNGYGNLLTASYPFGGPGEYIGWQAQSKDHLVACKATITAYAIGLKPKPNNKVRVAQTVAAATGAGPGHPGLEAHPSAQVCLDPAFTLTGGGAIDNWIEPGNLLTASFPSGGCWCAAGKDHIVSSPSDITVFAIGIRAV